MPPNPVAQVKVLGGGRGALIRHVYVPSVLTWVFSSLRITVGFAFTGAVVAEVIPSTEGLGFLLHQAQSSFDASLMMATVVIIMVMIMLIFAVLGRVEAHLMRWKQASRPDLVPQGRLTAGASGTAGACCDVLPRRRSPRGC